MFCASFLQKPVLAGNQPMNEKWVSACGKAWTVKHPALFFIARILITRAKLIPYQQQIFLYDQTLIFMYW